MSAVRNKVVAFAFVLGVCWTSGVPAATLFNGNLTGTPGTDIGGTVPAGGTAWTNSGGNIVFAPGGSGVQDAGPNFRFSNTRTISNLLPTFAFASLAPGEVLHLQVTMANIATPASSNIFESSRVDLVTQAQIPTIGDITLGELSFVPTGNISNSGNWGANTYAGSPITSSVTTGAPGTVLLDLYLDPNDVFGDGPVINAILTVNGGCPIRGVVKDLGLNTVITQVILVRNLDDEVFFNDLKLETIPAPRVDATVIFRDGLDGAPGTDIGGTVPFGGGAWTGTGGQFLFATGGGVQDVGPNIRQSSARTISTLSPAFALTSLAAGEVLHLQATMANISATPATNIFESTRVDLVTGTPSIGNITLGELSFAPPGQISNNGNWGANTYGGSPITSGITTGNSGQVLLDLYLDPNDVFQDGTNLNAIVTVNGGPPIRGEIKDLASTTVINQIQLVRNLDDEVFFNDLTLERMPACATPHNYIGVGCAPVLPDLVSWWRLNGDATDVTGNHPGSVVGGGGFFGPGEVGQGFHPDYSTIIESPDDASLNPVNITIDAWVFLDSLPIGNPCIVWKGDAGGIAYSSPFQLAVYGSAAGSLAGKALAVIANQSFFQELDAPSPIPIGSWVHLAMTADGSTFKLYQNGQLVAFALQTVIPGASGYPFQIGGTIALSSPNSFTGTIDEVELHSSAATAQQIAAIYAAGPIGKCPYRGPTGCAPMPAGLISWWKLNGDALDVTGHNPGSVNGPGGVFEPALVGKGFHADLDNYVEVPNDPSLNPLNLTIDCWVKLDSLPDGTHVIVWKGDPGGLITTSPYELGVYGLDEGPSLAGKAFAVLGDPYTGQEIDASILIPIGSWVHLAMTADAVTLRLYQDGNLVAFSPQTVIPGASGFPLQIGGIIFHSVPNSFPGLIDELEIHSVAASAGQIADIHTAGALGKCPDGTTGVGRPAISVLSFAASPNPSRGRFDFAINIPRPAPVRLEIYDVAGRRVARLLDGKVLTGRQSLVWNGKNQSGSTVSGGVYFARLSVGGSTRMARLVITR